MALIINLYHSSEISGECLTVFMSDNDRLENVKITSTTPDPLS